MASVNESDSTAAGQASTKPNVAIKPSIFLKKLVKVDENFTKKNWQKICRLEHVRTEIEATMILQANWSPI